MNILQAIMFLTAGVLVQAGIAQTPDAKDGNEESSIHLFASSEFLANSEAQTSSVPMRECDGCNAAEMKSAALARLGINFVYNLESDTIKRFDVYLDSTCVAPLGADGSSSNGRHLNGRGGGGCGTFRDATEMFVDSQVQEVFDYLHSAYVGKPTLFTQGDAGLPLPPDPYTGTQFDPRAAAWEYPQGAYMRLQEYAAQLFGNDALLRSQNPYLADFLRGWNLSIGSFTIGASTGSINTGLSWISNRATVDVKLCNQQGDCAIFRISRSNDGIFLKYLGSFDVAMNQYPQPATQSPNPHWQWDRSGSDGPSFAQNLRNRGVEVLGTSQSIVFCSHAVLTCARYESGTLIGCRLDCYRSP